MKAIAVYPGKPNSAHLTEVARPNIENIPNGRGVLVKVLRVGVDGTDQEINEALFAATTPPLLFVIAPVKTAAIDVAIKLRSRREVSVIPLQPLGLETHR